ncbi:MAG: LacI family DNA-binding transcriptional regulator [Sphingomonas sp.]|jgi:LacI family transcriptional regulator|uniref:LacI family DNA-binding transcriptional regulator n=1 Tax=Sphingomonas sp. TaxID=28214 RepID=UPI00356419B1
MKQQRSRRQRNAATIKDVARKAGVSPMTVSRVLNGGDNVHWSTRELVDAAIKALSYTPNPAARSLSGAAPVRIGLLYSNPSAAYLSEFLVGSLDYASRANVQIIVEKCDGLEQAREAATRLLSGGIEGIVLPPPLCDSQPLLEILRQADGLAVTVASGDPAPGFSAVSIDDHRAAFEMTRHIAALGHQRIGFIIGNPDQTASERRLAGYRDALEAVGLACDETLVVQGLFTYRSGLDAAEQLLGTASPPTAIFASNDDMAAATVAVAHRHGLDVPNDLAVCGFDDTALATTIWPELTTIHQPITDMALAAVELLVKEIHSRRDGHREPPRHLQLDFTLVRRQSDAAPRRRPHAKALRSA